MDWETAFFRQYQDACVGRMLRGILHNLNGVNQAFSLQAALLSNMFAQAERMLQEAAGSHPECQGVLEPVQDLLRKRAVFADQMGEKVEVSQRIVSRIQPLAQLYSTEKGSGVTLASIVEMEVEILTADSFFKHRIEKQVELAPDLPLLRRHYVELHMILFALLDSALTAMRGHDKPMVRLSARRTEEALIIEVRDTGPGVAPEAVERLFEPFFTTWPGSLGVGLFMVKKLLSALGGEIQVASIPGNTCFTVTLPLAAVA